MSATLDVSSFLLPSPPKLAGSLSQSANQYLPGLAQHLADSSVFSMSPKFNSHYDPLRAAIKPEPITLTLPPLAIDPLLEHSPRARRPDSALTPAESKDRGRRIISSPQSSSREQERSSDMAFRRRTDERRFDPTLERDRKDNHLGLQSSNKVELPGAAHLLNYSQMPHRVESLQMSNSHGRDYNHRYGYSHQPSPPPIATLSHSPSASVSSLDQSSTSSPHPSIRPLPRSSLDSTYMEPYYSQDHAPSRHPGPYAHPHTSPRSAPPYPYPPRPTFDHRYNSADSMNSSYQMPSAYPPHTTVPSMGTAPVPNMRNGQMYGSQQQLEFTNDATAKLSDRLRRRCFNCCTSDTSTWRRSNLSPGKVLCNKCGLFERTHSRPRPEQFPHRRGSMSSSSGPVRMGTPPTQLPPIMNQPQTLPPPHHYNHPSIAPLANVPESSRGDNSNALPGVQTWINSPPTPASLPNDVRHHERKSDGSHSSPPLARQQHRHGDSPTSQNSHAR